MNARLVMSGTVAAVSLSGLAACGSIGQGNQARTTSATSAVLVPERPTLTLAEGVLSEGGKKLATVDSKTIDSFTSAHTITSADGEVQGTITFVKSNGALQSRGDFPSIGRFYEVRYPGGTTIEQLLASFVKNGVLVDGKMNVEGLTQYCSARGAKLNETSQAIARLEEIGRKEECRRCEEDFRACQVRKSAERSRPRPGVRVTASCETGFRHCSFGGPAMASLADRKPDQWPCGPVPR
jgi:hypothetical protein